MKSTLIYLSLVLLLAAIGFGVGTVVGFLVTP